MACREQLCIKHDEPRTRETGCGSGGSRCPWRQRGARAQVLGRARGGPGTKLHQLSDGQEHPLAFHLTGSNIFDFTGAEALLPLVPQAGILHADKGHDSDRIRRRIQAAGALPNIPPRRTRRWKNCFSPHLCKSRNAIERMFGRLKEFRRIATRYDRNARNVLAALCVAAAVSYRLRVRSLMTPLTIRHHSGGRRSQLNAIGDLRYAFRRKRPAGFGADRRQDCRWSNFA